MRIEEAVEIACACAEIGADLIDVTGGTPILGGRRAESAETLAFAAAFTEVSQAQLALGGGVVDAASAQELIDTHGAALVSVGRPLLADPYWALRVASNTGIPTSLPPAYRLAPDAAPRNHSTASEGTVSSPDHPKRVDGLKEEE
jgi:2,4-dienoyl-CoA reductase-like NADH-dependent reductase (Old Yellow Enzyme family)